ncbi:putative membrane protein YgcG [Mycolicibacterium iranicum]|uniref:Putative membrane protein YgcG n=1 Tax=Mycolicibacterium iranicum TaxID=912594 RepID=A0A839QDP6_MYCIR|nr:hypothetical protein [Mycolicibacterium iranicum]MBB2992615.1 putative membrane protein YgcG [Mycolicibacterium iranicum]
MRVAVKPVITTSVALVGASVIAVTPIQASTPTLRAVESDVSLSASSLAYVPINMIEQALSAPANMVAAMDRLAAALVISGSWNENHANNQWGWDEANPAMLMEFINMAVPFPAFSEPWGRHLNWWATANLPMHEGCNYDCPDLAGMLDKMFKVPMSAFYSEEGYTFPVVKTPFNGEPTPWSEQNVKLDPAEPMKSLWDSWTAEPTGIKTTTWWEVVTAVANLSAALQITGHMPDWIAVREIETFFKHFLKPPAEEAETPSGDAVDTSELALVSTASVADEDALVGLSPAPQVRALRTAAAEESTVEGGVEAPASDAAPQDETSGVDETVSEETSAPASIVETATNVLKDKFASVQQDATDTDVDATEEAESNEAADDAGSDAAAEDSTTGGKHRKSDDTAKADTSTDSGADSSGSEGSGGSDSSGGGSSSGE